MTCICTCFKSCHCIFMLIQSNLAYPATEYPETSLSGCIWMGTDFFHHIYTRISGNPCFRIRTAILGTKHQFMCKNVFQSGIIWVCPWCVVYLSSVYRRYHYQKLAWLIISKYIWYTRKPINRVTRSHKSEDRKFTFQDVKSKMIKPAIGYMFLMHLAPLRLAQFKWSNTFPNCPRCILDIYFLVVLIKLSVL